MRQTKDEHLKQLEGIANRRKCVPEFLETEIEALKDE